MKAGEQVIGRNYEKGKPTGFALVHDNRQILAKCRVYSCCSDALLVVWMELAVLVREAGHGAVGNMKRMDRGCI